MRLALLRLRQKVNFRLVRLLLIGMDASIFHILYTNIIYKNLTGSSLIKNSLFFIFIIQHFDYPITDYSTVRTQWVFTFVIYSRVLSQGSPCKKKSIMKIFILMCVPVPMQQSLQFGQSRISCFGRIRIRITGDKSRIPSDSELLLPSKFLSSVIHVVFYFNCDCNWRNVRKDFLCLLDV